jgi:hypothetical protein
MTTFTASLFHRSEKPYGTGKSADQRHQRIVGGWRGEVISGLPEGWSIYTGVCMTREETKTELVHALKSKGFTGTLKFI